MLKFEPHRQAGTRTARLEQRTTPETKDLIERAAALQGVNASEFVLAHAALAARETINRLEATVLTPADRQAFLQAFDAEPTTDLVALLSLHKELTGGK
ncbi:MAG TPA: DUF1778 domain-containing protein [Rhodospirillaceae bacterium]|nr:DUF1778 domain-containing protein [Rhodospirillaceae bacterium]